MNWQELFRRLLVDVEQIPHPMAEEIWEEYTAEISEEEEE
jgi:hypothetical protein